MAKTYAQFLSQIDALRAKADAVRRKEAAGQIKRVRDLIALYGLTAEDLGLSAGPASRKEASAGNLPTRNAGNTSKPTANGPKYRDDAGHSWTGRGPKPSWLKAALAEGRSIEEFTAQPATSSPKAAPATKSAGRKPAGKKAASKSAGGTVKFRLGEHAWSGRGPQPRWLKDALGAGKTIDDLRVG